LTLTEALSIKEREVISLVGAGGKTTLMFALGRELSLHKRGILLTTTTKIWDPGPSCDFALFCSPKLGEIKDWVEQNLNRHRYLLVAREKLVTGKLQGIPAGWVGELHSVAGVSHIIVEADGAAGRPLKAPREGEPVVPPDTTLMIAVVGIDALGDLLTEDHVFRSKIAMKILDQPEGAIISEQMIAKLVAESLKNMLGKVRVVPFLNKVDLPNGLEKGRNLARILVEAFRPRIDRVVLGHAGGSHTVAEIVTS